MDLHQGQIQGFFNIPVDELTAVHILSNYFNHKHLEDLVVVTDLGFAKRARTFAELLDAPLAIIEKRRVGNLDRAELMNVIGDVRGKRAIIVDDEIDTAGTLIEIVRALEREGVTEIYACATHGVLCGPAVERIRDSSLREVVLTDSVPLPAIKRMPKITTLSVAPLIGEAIKRIHRGESVGALFSSEVQFTQEMLLWEDGQEKRFDTRNEPGHERRRRRAPTIGAVHSRPSSRRPPGRATDEPPAPPARRQGRHRDAAGPRPRLARAAASRRAGARRASDGRLPELPNPEMNPTSTPMAVLFWLGLGAADVRAAGRRLRDRVLELRPGPGRAWPRGLTIGWRPRDPAE